MQTVHLVGSCCEMRVIPDDDDGGDGVEQVEAVFSMQDCITFPPLLLGLVPLEVRGGGYYHEIWVRKKSNNKMNSTEKEEGDGDDGEWRLKSLRLQRNLLQDYVRMSVCLVYLCSRRNYLSENLLHHSDPI